MPLRNCSLTHPPPILPYGGIKKGDPYVKSVASSRPSRWGQFARWRAVDDGKDYWSEWVLSLELASEGATNGENAEGEKCSSDVCEMRWIRREMTGIIGGRRTICKLRRRTVSRLAVKWSFWFTEMLLSKKDRTFVHCVHEMTHNL